MKTCKVLKALSLLLEMHIRAVKEKDIMLNVMVELSHHMIFLLQRASRELPEEY